MSKSIDETDLKILAELDINARTTASEIGRKLDLSKNRVTARTKNLEESGVIKGCTAIVDFLKLGYSCNRLYIKFQHTNNTIEKEIVDYLMSSRYTLWCCRIRGRFDVVTTFWSKTMEQFTDLWNNFRTRYKPYIKETFVNPFYGEVFSSLPFTKHMLKRANNSVIRVGKQLKIDEKNRAILRILASDARMPLRKIGSAVGLTPGAVKYRIDQLVELGAIAGFRPDVNMEKLGYMSCKVDFNFSSLKDQEKVEQYVLNNLNISHIIRTAGWADLEIRAYAKTSNELYDTLDSIRDKFYNEIQDYNLLHMHTNTMKWSFMPDF